ncbi:MAG: hydroxymethylbilane synthase [Bacillota bacterium]|nr:hydroxymethylbilane synthase [Bacillota bacterium]
MNRLTIGTRGSRLAIIQADIVKEALIRANPALVVDLKIIKTKGDLVTDIPLEKIGDKGVFIKELENALLAGEIDLAVHSMKDMPTALPPGLIIGAIMARELPWDVLITAETGKTLAAIAPGALIGSSSLRRRAQLLHHYPHLNIQSVRGNLDTRYKRLEKGDYGGIILAYAGVARMGWLDRISEVISGDICLPAVGQGAIGVEIREGDSELFAAIAGLNCSETSAAVTAERSFLRELEGGCQVPIGALAEIADGEMVLKGMVASLDGKLIFRGEEKGWPQNAQAIGSALAGKLLQKGCGSILEQIRQECSLNEQ